MPRMTIFSHVSFKDLGELLEQLYDMHNNILIAGNLQPDFDDEYWKMAEENYFKIKRLLRDSGV